MALTLNLLLSVRGWGWREGRSGGWKGQELFWVWEACNPEFPKNNWILCRVIKIILPSKNSPPWNQRPGFNYSHYVLRMYRGTQARAGSLQISSGATLP